MKIPKIGVTPYLCGDTLMMSVEIDGKEAWEGEIPLSLLFKHFAEVIDPNDEGHENEAYSLIHCLEEGVRTVNDVLGADEE